MMPNPLSVFAADDTTATDRFPTMKSPRLHALFLIISAHLIGGASLHAEQETIITGTGSYYLIDDVNPTDSDYGEPSPLGGGDANVQSWGGDNRWGDGTVSATWSFAALEDGEYTVYASWKNVAQGNVGPTNYTGTDGFTDAVGGTAEAVLDQSPGADAPIAGRGQLTLNDGAMDISFQELGTVTVSDGDFVVTMTDGAGDGVFVFADAIAIGPIPIGDDADGDGMPDDWEDMFGLDKNEDADAALDGDSDGLSNLDEYRNQTLPNDPDTDDDTLQDGFEVNTFGSDPTEVDSEGDGLDDAAEQAAGTDPNRADTDGDGGGDRSEVDTGTDPTVHGPVWISAGENDFLVIDNLASAETGNGYAEPGPFGGEDLNQPDSWAGDRRWGNQGGALTDATWTFSGLESGTYDVYASWKNGGQANLTDVAPYTVSDGGGQVIIDQRTGPDALPGIVELADSGARSIFFAPLASAVEVGDGELTVTLNDDETPGGGDDTTFVIADAVAIVRTGGALTPFVITAIDYDPSTSVVELEWNSRPTRTYSVFLSTDLTTDSWIELDDSVPSGGDSTTYMRDVAGALAPQPVPDAVFFQVRLVPLAPQ